MFARLVNWFKSVSAVDPREADRFRMEMMRVRMNEAARALRMREAM